MRTIIPLIHEYKAICVTVEYRLAPEWKAPTQLEDCYHGLIEAWKQRKAFGINDRLLLVGRSAGANLAAGVALHVRDSKDEEKPRICGQILSFPMLDHTSTTASEKFSDSPAWPICNNQFAWSQYLGDKENVTIYTVPGIAQVQDLHDCPPTLVEIADIDCLGTEARQFGDRLKEAGNDVEINSWEKFFHCGDWALSDRQDLYQDELQFRLVWVGRYF
jgi:acetyl esterase/lipase